MPVVDESLVRVQDVQHGVRVRLGRRGEDHDFAPRGRRLQMALGPLGNGVWSLTVLTTSHPGGNVVATGR